MTIDLVVTSWKALYLMMYPMDQLTPTRESCSSAQQCAATQGTQKSRKVDIGSGIDAYEFGKVLRRM